MKTALILKKAAGHLCIICSIVLLIIQILDWYNPFMDFMGHAMFVLYILCASATGLGIYEVYLKRLLKDRRERARRRTEK